MGEARRETQQEVRDAEIGKTFEGRVAQKVKDAMEKAKAEREKGTQGKTG